MKVSAQELRLHDARSHKLGFLVPVLGAFTITAAICNGATPAQETTQTIWPTKEWQTATPEKEGMDSKELAKLVDWGTTHGFDCLLVVRHGKILAEAYYADNYGPGIASFSLAQREFGRTHPVYSVTKSVIGTLTAIAWKNGVLDSLNHRVLDFFDRRSIANIDPRKEAITVQNLLDMTSGIEWTEQVGASRRLSKRTGNWRAAQIG
jgi:CubicO group peptidase (beta-lactamase class C family)